LLASALLLGAAGSAPAAGKLDPRLRMIQKADRGTRHKLAKDMGHELDEETPSARVLIRLKPGVSKDQLESLFPGGKFRSQNGPVVTALVPVDLLDSLGSSPLIENVEAARKAEPKLDVVLSGETLAGGYLGVLPGGKREINGVQGEGVVVGFVDTGIDWKHKDFTIDYVSSATTRIHAIWDQMDVPGGGCSSPSFGYGCQWLRADINNELDGTPAGVVRSSDTNGHGTHVAGIACGDGSATDGDEPASTYMGLAQAVEIVMVKTDYTQDHIIDGINYIIQQAQGLGRRAVINLSLGSQTGSHDGFDSYELAVNEVAKSTPVVASAGDDQKNQVHASVEFTTTGSTTVVLNVGASRTWMEAEFWHTAVDSYTASVGFYECGDADYASHGAVRDTTICSGNVSLHIANGDFTGLNGAHQIYIRLQSATPLPATLNVALTREGGAQDGARVDGFVSLSHAKFGSHHDGGMSINEPGNGADVITVGSYCAKNSWDTDSGGTSTDADCGLYSMGAISAFSSPGPTRDGRTKPDLSAPGQNTASAMSIAMNPAATSDTIAKDGKHRLVRGTSQAAPVVTGAIALKLGLDPTLTAGQIRGQLKSQALVDDRTGTPGEGNYLFGYGKVHATPPISGRPDIDESMLSVSSITIRWSWGDSSAYNNAWVGIHRAGDAGELSGELPYTQTSWLQTSLMPNTSYSAFLTASNSIDTSSGPVVSTWTLAAPPVAQTPSSVAPTFVVVNWVSNGNPGGTEYRAQAASDQGFGSIVGDSDWTTSLSAPFASLSVNTTYYFRVRARNALNTETVYTVLPATPTAVYNPAKPPSAPIPSVSSVTVSWLANGNPDGTQYMVERARNPQRTLDPWQAPWSTDTSYDFTGLTPNTTYYFGVRARNLARVPSSAEVLDSIVTLATPPTPSTVNNVYESSFTANWWSAGNPSWTEYRVERATDTAFTKGTGDSGWLMDQYAYTFTGLIPNTTYYLRVWARNSQGVPTDPAALATTLTLPAPPTSLEPDSVSSGSLVARWGKGLNPDGTRFNLVCAYDPGFASQVLSATQTSTSRPMAGLIPDTSYYMRVRALNQGDAPSPWVALPTTATLAEQPGSLAPTGVLDVQITARWDGKSNPGSTQYFVQRSMDPDFQLDVASSGWIAAPSHTFRDLAMTTTYYMRVKARNLAGTETPYTALPSTVTMSVKATPPPEGINFPLIGPTQLSARWTLMSPNEAPLYVLASTPDFSVSIASQTGFAGQEEATFYSLSPDSSYYFKIKVSTASDLFYSEPRTVLTRAQPPSTAAVSNLTVDSFQANWSVNGNPAYTRFLYERALDAKFTTGLTSSPWVTGSSYSFPGLSVNTRYFVRVRGRNQAGIETPVSSTSSVSTKAYPPGTEPPTDIGPNSVRTHWTANGNPAGTEYLCERMEGAYVGDYSGWTTGLQYEFAGLVPNTTYNFFVRARNRDGLNTAVLELPAALTLSAVPASIAASEVSPVTLRANWGSNGNAPGTQYSVELSTVNGFSSGDITVSAWAAQTTYLFTPLPVNVQHFLRVRARNAAGTPSAYSNLPPVATLATPPVPGGTLPQNIHITSVTVNWGPGDNPPGTLYYAESCPYADYHAEVKSSAVDSVLSHTFTNLAPNTTYYFRVRARNVSWVATDPVALPTVLTKAAAPGPGALPGSAVDSILWPWDPSGNPPGTQYYAEADDMPDFVGAANSGWITSSSHTFGSLSVNTTYYFRARAKNHEDIPGGWSATSAFATLAREPLAQLPSGVGADALTIRWDQNGNPGSTQYLAEASTRANFSPATGSGWVTGASAAFGGLVPNTEYHLRVRGRSHNGGETSIVTEGSTVTLANAPTSAAPSLVFDVSIMANWGANGNPAGTQYMAQRALNDTFSVGVDNSPWSEDTGYTFTGLQKSTQYYFRVKAKNLGGTETSYTTLPTAATLSAVPVPTGVRFSAASQTGLTAQWLLHSPDNQPVYQLSGRRDFSVIVASAIGPAQQQSASFYSLTPNTSYFFKVRLSTASDDYYSVPIVSATLPVAPGPPVQVNMTSSALTVSYATNGNGTGSFYLTEADTDSGFPSVDSSSRSANAWATLSGLSPNTRYYVRARTQHHGGVHSAYATILAMATLARPPVPPAGAAILGVTYSSVTAQWVIGGACSGYVLQASTSSDFSGTLYSQSQSGDVSRLSVGGIAPGTTVYLRAGSLNMDGATNFLALGSTVTLPAAVSQSTTNATQVLQFNLSPQDPELDSIQITIPPATFPSGTPVTVNTGVRFSMPPPRSDMAQLTPVGNGLGVDISAGGLQPNRPVSIVVTYDAAAFPASLDPRSIVIARYDDTTRSWVLLPTRVDTQSRTITAETTHFSIFALFVSAAASALDAVKVSPVPWEPGSGSQFDAQVVTFSNMPAGTSVEIFTLLGESLWKGEAPASGAVTWDGRNSHRVRTGSGTYLAVIRGGGQRKVVRVVVTR
jgi:hypothetical protein